MYGVPLDLPLQPFVGEACTEVGFGLFQITFSFGENGPWISSERHWELIDGCGDTIDIARPNDERDHYRVQMLIGRRVTGFRIDPPRSCSLLFQGGYELTLIDSDDQYESFIVRVAEGMWIV